MVRKSFGRRSEIIKRNVKADVIILGCSLPGIVTAHKLKKKFGDTMDIVVLDLSDTTASEFSKCNVIFQDGAGVDDEEDQVVPGQAQEAPRVTEDNVAKHYLTQYARDFNIPLPDVIISPTKIPQSPNLQKLFQYTNGSIVECASDYQSFEFLSYIEKFELEQYQRLLDASMKGLFKNRNVNEDDTKTLMYYDQTTMESHICQSLLFATPREIMRTTVRLVCGAGPDQVSVLFYLHQCHRTSSSKNHLGGDNTRFREKLLGHCRKRLTKKLQQSVADITMPVRRIKEIRTYSDEQVILETRIGETNYVCSLLAMALRPDQLLRIRVEGRLLAAKEVELASAMAPGRCKKFIIRYEDAFWREEGYSGDILSIHGPILWAMERPVLSATGSSERYASLVGYLKVKDDDESAKEAVIEQLVKLFGDEAALPVSYTESDISDVFVPRFGDYVALTKLTHRSRSQIPTKNLDWGALDIFADGDLAAALEAGHTTFVRILGFLRPQAETFEDVRGSYAVDFNVGTMPALLCRLNVYFGVKMIAVSTAAFVGYKLLKHIRGG